MQRYKILIASAFVVFTLSVFISRAFNAESTKAPKKAVTASTIEKDPKIDKEVLLYASRQKKLQAALNAYFKKAIANGDVVGAGVSIVTGDSIVISDGFGTKKSTDNSPVNGETVFRLGSLSKGFAGMLAANIKHEGKLNWTDRVSDYLPEFQLGDGSNTKSITLANILSHTSGTPYHSYTNLVEAGLPLKDIAKRFKEVMPISKPGIMYSYQNAMFALCGEMMKKATGKKINTLLDDRFFKPLEMCTTTTDFETLTHEANIAMPHVKARNGWRAAHLRDNYYNAVAAGGISSNAHDMGRWMRFLLGHNPDVMDSSAIREAFNPFIEISGHRKYYQRWPGHTRSYYGFGWRIHKFTEGQANVEKTIWHHGGSVNNYRNEIAVYPESDLGICVLLNNNSPIAKTVIPDLYEIVKKVYKEEEATTSKRM
ncbi:serine hydrolase domain-containing protein [Zobellia galactanivorans]|uniref:serine hydrolase domain-containing protein n=1 Tax=Zobellia TaxID=112040 RepID=UPI000B52FDFD|nr:MULTISPECIES: serine hydrolase domain-containing protein [Zobellia]MDO6808950.1 serine hydrolase domain-containing protein [Zobellia galactanivorans]OWW25923.1 serine hydrolase [Zobellia sp. OII3]